MTERVRIPFRPAHLLVFPLVRDRREIRTNIDKVERREIRYADRTVELIGPGSQSITFEEKDWYLWMQKHMSSTEPEYVRRNEALLMASYCKGVRYQIRKELVGIPLPKIYIDVTNDLKWSRAYALVDKSIIAIQKHFLTESAQNSMQDEFQAHYSSPDENKLRFVGLIPEDFFLSGIEEADHIAFSRNHEIDFDKVKPTSKGIPMAQYYAQPHEFHAAYEVLDFVDKHPAKFHPQLLLILKERVAAAKKYLSEHNN